MAGSKGPTKTDVGANEWLITDAPTHFRLWGSCARYPLPAIADISDSDGGWIIGASEDCWLQLQDTTGRVSRRHARVIYDRERRRWAICDLDSKNGITHDGARELSFDLNPGIEVGIGGVPLIVESPLLEDVRELLGRFIGWSDDRALDIALRSVRLAATRREPLQLCGDDDLVSIARLLHRRVLGDARPFVVCARPRARKDARPSQGGPDTADYESGMAALAAAKGGTLCISQRRPNDFAEVVEASRNATSRVQLIVCLRSPEPSRRRVTSPIIVPPLTERSSELNRVVDAYAVDAGALPGGTLTASDREWVRSHESKTLAKIEEATRRLVAIRANDTNLTRAAAQLGMSLSALHEWLARRSLDIDDGTGDDE